MLWTGDGARVDHAALFVDQYLDQHDTIRIAGGRDDRRSYRNICLWFRFAFELLALLISSNAGRCPVGCCFRFQECSRGPPD